MSDWIFSVIDRLGSAGVGLLVQLENLIPPIPSEVILPLAGFRPGRGNATDPRLRRRRGLPPRHPRSLRPSAAGSVTTASTDSPANAGS